MKITLFGAAGNVTGSAYYVQTKSSKLLIDFGLFQGDKELEIHNSNLPPINLDKLDAVLLTHAHMDHTGRLPLLVKGGWNGPIYATEATIDITALILLDSVKVQNYELKRKNRKRERLGKSLLKPVYTEDDVQKVLSLMKPVPYNTPVDVSQGISSRWRESGHILGSASIELTVKEEGQNKVVVFSGDIGPDDMAIIKDPEPFSSANLVFMESTYGDHDHKSLQDTLLEGKNIIEKAINEKGKILVPSFAVGRTQQLLYYISRAVHRGNLPQIPVYLDSPMAIDATKIYLKHKELYDDEAAQLFQQGVIKGDFSNMHVSKTAEDSMALNELSGPCMIIAGAGMCNAGRILHHLKHNLWKPQTTVLIVGYQGQGSIGRKLLDGEKKVKIYGEEVVVKANITSMGGLSAHADQSGLIKWFGAVASSKPRLVLSHGEDRGRKPLAKLIKKRYGIEAILPKYGETIKL